MEIKISYGDESVSHHPTFAKNGMVSTVDHYATTVGRDILEMGGNAIDAAVAIGFTLAVTHPQAGNLGGGGFMVLRTKKGVFTTINFREKAPYKASERMFQNGSGEVDPNASLVSYQAVAVPGTVKGLLHALEQYGTLPRAIALAPAIKLAKEGFIVREGLANDLKQYGDIMRSHNASRRIFFYRDEPIQYGERLIQKDLAESLIEIAEEGADAFYRGSIADKIVEAMKAHGGLITHEDLQQYQIDEPEPIVGSYKGYHLYSMAPPSSGGVHLIQLLNILEYFDLKSFGHNSAKSIHLITEALKQAYADRHNYMGDPNFVKVPTHLLTNKEYAKIIANGINHERTTPSSEIKGDKLSRVLKDESSETTHYSIMDRQGNAVGVTYTLNTNFGSGIIPEGTGILLNNIMDNFATKPGVPNIYGVLGSEKNRIEPGKRPLSCMSPVIVTKGFQPIMVTGSPGGSRIITTVLQMLLNVLEYGLNIAEATSAPRFHHQWLPDQLELEKGFSTDTIELLKGMGHSTKTGMIMGCTHTVYRDSNGFYGANDSRAANGSSLGID